uniref:NADH-ubiquinone oxidoreductase chain 4 n=1 Tax=Euaspis polynesia TaxID=1352276 RepID=A0A7T4WNX0_9HYME|nr:NADH dehydrogenase subunit 4 [Euaspis polynesia]QQD78164.1 NADH dehydrogenase subunit 4 [Euaspis polynesia]
MLIYMMMIFMMMMSFNLFKKKFLISSIMFLLSLFLMMKLNFSINWISMGIMMGINEYSIGLVLLSLWIMGLVILMLKNLQFLMNLVMMLLLVLMMNFLSMNLLLFYLMFEISLIFIFVLINKYGLSIMRLSASFYLLFYTLFFSLPMLFILFYMMNLLKIDNFLLFEFKGLMMKDMNLIYLMYLFGAFLVKLPMFMLHNWLLKAHVEAPVYGSMILASLMLKLGSYGLLRFIFIFYVLMKSFEFMVMYGLLGGIIMSLMCFRQLDMKVLVAMSSVVHMNLMMSSLFSMYKIGILGSYITMIAHGLCSSGMFYMLNLCYLETNSRLMLFNKGLMVLNPTITLLWFLMCSSNMSAPMSMNLVGELFMMISIIMVNKLYWLLLFIYCLFSFMYSIYFFSYINHGNLSMNNQMKGVKMLDYLILIMHLVPLFMLVFNLDLFI